MKKLWKFAHTAEEEVLRNLNIIKRQCGSWHSYGMDKFLW